MTESVKKLEDLPPEIKNRIFKEAYDPEEKKQEIIDLMGDRAFDMHRMRTAINTAMENNNLAIELFEAGDPIHAGFLNVAFINHALANNLRESIDLQTENINKVRNLYYFHDMNRRYRLDREF